MSEKGHPLNPVSAQGSEPSLELRDGSLWQLVEESETGCRWVPVISRERLRKLIDGSPSVSTGEVDRAQFIERLTGAITSFDGTSTPSWRGYVKDTLLPLYIEPRYAAKDAEIAKRDDTVSRLSAFSKELIDQNYELRHQSPRCSFCQSLIGHTEGCWTVTESTARQKAESKLVAAEQTIADQKKRIAELEGGIRSAASHLRVAVSQSLPSDDQIIMSHIAAALEALKDNHVPAPPAAEQTETRG